MYDFSNNVKVILTRIKLDKMLSLTAFSNVHGLNIEAWAGQQSEISQKLRQESKISQKLRQESEISQKLRQESEISQKLRQENALWIIHFMANTTNCINKRHTYPKHKIIE